MNGRDNNGPNSQELALQELVHYGQKVVPELIQQLEKRYTILRSIYFAQPIGRRVLAANLRMGERIVRNETDFLRTQGLVEAQPGGMVITPEGEEVIFGLEQLIRLLKGLTSLEEELASRLGLHKVIVVSGDLDQDRQVLKEMGRAGANFLQEIIHKDKIETIAVTGGTSTLSVVESLPEISPGRSILVVPARGGFGTEMRTQANAIAALLAGKLGGEYRLFHVPDALSPQARLALLEEPHIQEMLRLMTQAQLVIHGIGDAVEMAKRRHMPQVEISWLMRHGAVGEALGSYVDKDGKVVLSARNIGLNLQELPPASTLAVAGGKHKAQAILAVAATGVLKYLVTDEGAAQAMLETLRKKN